MLPICNICSLLLYHFFRVPFLLGMRTYVLEKCLISGFLESQHFHVAEPVMVYPTSRVSQQQITSSNPQSGLSLKCHLLLSHKTRCQSPCKIISFQWKWHETYTSSLASHHLSTTNLDLVMLYISIQSLCISPTFPLLVITGENLPIVKLKLMWTSCSEFVINGLDL